MWAEIEACVEQQLQTQQDALLQALTAQVCQYHRGVAHDMTELAKKIAKEWHARGMAQQTKHAYPCKANSELENHPPSPAFLSLGTVMGAIKPAATEAKIEQSGTDVAWGDEAKYQDTNKGSQCAPLPIQQREDRMFRAPNCSRVCKSTAAGQHSSIPSPHSDSSLAEFLDTHHADSRSNLQKFVEGSTFDVISSMMVIVCTLMMALESQYAGMQAGYVIKSPGCTAPASHKWPNVKDVLVASELAFNILFSGELVLWFIALKQDACRRKWIYLDTLLVISGWVSYCNGFVMVNPLILRLARLMRLARVVKLFRNAQVVQTLFLLVRSIRASFGCLLWSFLLLWFFQIAMAILMSQLVQPSILDESKDIKMRLQLFAYFGTFSRGLVTMFEVTMANWVPSCRLLYDNISEWFGGIYIVYRCCFMFAVIKVITAVFVAETVRCANSDVELAVQRKRREHSAFLARCTELFHHLDRNQDGEISWDELELLVTDTTLQNILEVLEIDTHDLMTVFTLHDRGDGCFDLQSFMSSLSHVKGPAKSIDVLKLATSVDAFSQKVDAIVSKSSDWRCFV